MKNTRCTLPIVVLCLSLLTACSETVVKPLTPGKTNTPPNAPSDAIAELISENQIKISWQDNSLNENGFIVSRGDKKFGWTDIATINNPDATSYLDTIQFEEIATRRICYLVRAFNKAGESDVAISNEIEIRRD